MERIAIVPSVKKNLDIIEQCGEEPILLEGPTGCGKTTLVEYLAQKVSKTLVKVQLGEQSDSKSILGTYCCSEIPGLFYWRNSAILEAMMNGHWLLLEDLDQSPVDVLGVLLPLLETRSLLVPGLGNEKVEAKRGFRMFATSRLVKTPSGYSRIQTNPQFNVVAKLFLRIIVEAMSKKELVEAITGIYKFTDNEVREMVDIYQTLVDGKSLSSSSSDDDDDDDDDEEEQVPKYATSRLRQFTMRDLMKWCNRVQKYSQGGNRQMTKDEVLPDAFDVFAAGVPGDAGRLAAHQRVVRLFGLDVRKAETHCKLHKAVIRESEEKAYMGRHVLRRFRGPLSTFGKESPKFARTRQSSNLLESIAGCVMNNEPVLLVGETGTGKTSTVQYLAHSMNADLKVINMNQQSDSSDLLGAYRPIEVKKLVRPLWERFHKMFGKAVDTKSNQNFLRHIDNMFVCDQFKKMFATMRHALSAMLQRFQEGHEFHQSWLDISQRIDQLETLVEQCTKAPAFTFVEGALVRAIKNGDWILLDEINLATSETLESLCGLLESTRGSVTLADRGDHEPVHRHENFRLFACMNPAADVGKKDLPGSLRGRFTEFYVDEMEDRQELEILVKHYLPQVGLATVDGAVNFYLDMRRLSATELSDGVGRCPHFSMRTLCRALRTASSPAFGELTRSIYEGFSVSFLTQLDRRSYDKVKELVDKHLLGGKPLKSHPFNLLPTLTKDLIQCQGYLILKGDLEPEVDEGYILTPSVERNLKDLARAVAARRLPVLLQGETSVGKTSMITYLAKATGNKCYRINNHEHTDVQEYVGTYAADGNGQLVFKEGTLVKAMRKGHWIILDELNLAPTEVLEALNRLLDDNRELFIPETQETVKAHERFLVFATQNPAGLYGGRKVLSRAFRNRFVELHFDEIPRSELELILTKRTGISPSHSKKLVDIMHDLQRMRRNSSLFVGKQGFITLRELFRWAERYNRCAKEATSSTDKDWDQIFADQGYVLLAGKVRHDSEEEIIRKVIWTNLKREINVEGLFSAMGSLDAPRTNGSAAEEVRPAPSLLPTDVKDKKQLRKMKKQMRREQKEARERTTEEGTNKRSELVVPGFEHVVMTKAMKRMAVLVSEAVKHQEPVLLVGETGCGKTTICQMLAKQLNIDLLTLNCHLHTETSDFLGGLRPVRHREEKSSRLFEWRDGPLVTSMKVGSMFLIDEISLADDSVLERLNSVLEPERKILLVEKGDEEEALGSTNEIVADEKFRLVATMNPGGDFGKKELSPALRNRFTEIWCPLSHEVGDWIRIVEHNLKQGLPRDIIAKRMAEFVSWVVTGTDSKKIVVSIRDLLSWTAFVNAMTSASENQQTVANEVGSSMVAELAYIHGALMVFVDALQTDQSNLKDRLLQFLCNQVNCGKQELIDQLRQTSVIVDDRGMFSMGPFKIPRGPLPVDQSACDFAFHAPTTSSNAVRVMRALQLHRPILLEGSPGVGKTSLVLALAKASGRNIVRINLSDQTDVSDLFGADLPIDGGKCGEFRWVDGPLLAGLKAGHWIVLDELNLASQSVLEGLNACFDHRSEVFIPELCQTFSIDHERTRIFACQNPVFEGGDRKGLPKSFLNRFTQVYVDQLSFDDLIFILQSLHPEFPERSLSAMVAFNQMMHRAINQEKRFGKVGGGAWDFNLRDLLRWCQLCIKNKDTDRPGRHLDVVYMMRLRTDDDRHQAAKIFERVFNEKYSTYMPSSDYMMTESLVQVGNSFVKRSSGLKTGGRGGLPLRFLQRNARPLASLVECVNMNWMAILVGPSGCGKTCLLRTLSGLTGRELHTMSMNSNMDTTELLGSFEQASFRKKFKAFTEKWSQIVRDNCEGHEYLTTFKQLWSELVRSEKEIICQKETVGKSPRAVETLSRMRDVLVAFGKANGGSELIRKLEESLVTMEELCSTVECGKFEWVDSLLLTCMKRGAWIVLDNINFCSSSVLDRLNGVLEPNGRLRLDELGTNEDGMVPEIAPHPNFRLFLTMDPKNGDISRAMRNRGIEISMMQQKGEEDTEDVIGLLNDTGASAATVRSILGFQRSLWHGRDSDVPGLVRASGLISARSGPSGGVSEKSLEERQRIVAESFRVTFVDGCHDSAIKKTMTDLVDRMIGEHFSLATAVCVLPLPNLRSWMESFGSSLIWKASALLRRILHALAGIEVLPSLEADIQSALGDGLPLKLAAMLAIQSNSSRSLNMLPKHLRKQLGKKQMAKREDLVAFAGEVISVLSFVSNHPLVESFMEVLGDCEEKGFLPMNIYKNSAFLHFSNLSQDAVAILRNICRQLPILYNWIMIGSDLKRRIDAAQPMAIKQGTGAVQRFSFIQLAKSHSSGLVHVDSLPHPMLLQLALYCSLTVEEVGNTLRSALDWKDESINRASEGLHWLGSLVEGLSGEVEWGRTADERMMDASMLAKWANKKLSVIFGSRFSTNHASLVERLRSSLDFDGRIDKFHAEVVTAFGRATVFTDQSDASAFMTVQSLLSRFFSVEEHLLSGNRVKSRDVEKWIAFLGREEVAEAKQQLANQAERLAAGFRLIGDEANLIAELESTLENHHREIFTDVEGDVVRNSTDDVVQNLPTWFYLQPIRCYFMSCHSSASLPLLLSSTDWQMGGCLARPLAEISTGTCLADDYNVYTVLSSNLENSVKFKAIGTHLRSLRSNSATKVVPFAIGILESVRAATRKSYNGGEEEEQDDEDDAEGRDFDCGVLRQAMRDSLPNIFCGFSSCIFEAIDASHGMAFASDNNKSPGDENCSWLLSSVQLKLAEKKLRLAKSLEGHVWSYLANRELDVWDILTNNGKVLEACVGLVSDCLSRLSQVLPSDTALLKRLFDAAKRHLEKAKSLIGDRGDFTSVGVAIGAAWLCLGQLQLVLLSPREGSVDRVRKVGIRLAGVKTMIKEVEMELILRKSERKINGGCAGDEEEERDEDIIRLNTRLEVLRAKEEKLLTKLAYRPTPSQYPELCRELARFARDDFGADRVAKATEELVCSFEGRSRGDWSKGLASLASSFGTVRGRVTQFLRRFERSFHLYPDETTNVVAALRQCEFGADVLLSAVKVELDRIGLTSDLGVSVDGLASSMVSFPVTSSSSSGGGDVLDLVEFFLSKEFLLMLRRFEDRLGSYDLVNRILKACSLLLLNAKASRIDLSSRPSERHVHLLNQVASTYHSRWQKQEDEKRKHEEEEANLFKFKVIGSTGTEDEIDAAEILRDFPTFAEDFEDIEQRDSFAELPTPKPKMPAAQCITDEDLDHFVSVYLGVMGDDGVRGKKETEVDWFPYWNLIHRMTFDVFKDACHTIDPKLERNLMANHLMALCFVQSALEGGRQQARTEKFPNVYKDCDVGNATRCLTVLRNLAEKISGNLAQWPEHPTLIQLMTIIERISSFPVSSPPMRFVRGLEMILEIAQSWEEKASKLVSLMEQLGEVTRLVKTWRGMELRGWKASLDQLEEEARNRSARWWYHMYAILQSQLKDLNEGKVELLGADVKLSVLRSLEELMEKSPVGEFRSRLKIVLSFHHYLNHLASAVPKENCKKALGSLANIFLSIYEHYSQFDEHVENGMKELRTPVEKELKEHIKIVSRQKDEDVNYFSVRSLCHKSHKTVHKHVKQYRQLLQQPSGPLLVDKSVDWRVEETEKKKKRKEKRETQKGVCDLTSEMFLISEGDVIELKMSQRFKRMTSFCRRLIDKSSLARSIEGLDAFSTDVIETVRHLEALKPEEGATKERRIKELKRIQTMKRKALSDLFKALRVMGLSHKKGLAHHDSASPEEISLRWFESTPAPDKVVGLGGSGPDEPRDFLADQMKKCKSYLTRCFSRRSLLMASLANHNKDMDGVSLERSKGYCEHLHAELLARKELLGSTLRTFQRLRFYLNDFEAFLSVDAVGLPRQDEANYWKVEAGLIGRKVVEFLHQLKFFVETVTLTDSSRSEEDAKFLSLVTPDEAEISKANYVAAKEMIARCLEEVMGNSLRSTGSKDGTLIVSLSEVGKSYERLSRLAKDLRAIDVKLSLVKDPEGRANRMPVVSAGLLIEEIERNCRGFEEFRDIVVQEETMEVEDDSQLDEFKATCQSLATSCLKGVERLVKEAQAKKDAKTEKMESAKSIENVDEEKEEEDDSGPEQNIIASIGLDSLKCMEALDMTKVANQLSSLVAAISDWSVREGSADRMRAAAESMKEIGDVVVQYGRLAQFFVTMQASGLKETSKLQAILLRLFSELAEKGFCTPPELSEQEDQTNGAQGMKFNDIEEAGMGEGDGMKDVSDQIDNEGQIEGLQGDKQQDKKKDEEEEEEGEDNAIEMSNDFDGELSDPKSKDQNDEDDDDEDGADESEIEKQMGEVGDAGEDEEKLDEKMWGDDESEEEDDNPENKMDDHGKGTNADDKEKELGAKGAQEGDEQEKGNERKKDEEEEEEEDNADDDDEGSAGKEADHVPDHSQYDEEADSRAAKDGPKEEEEESTEADDLEIPEDLKIEDDGQGESGDAMPEENVNDNEKGKDESGDDDDDDGEEEEEGGEENGDDNNGDEEKMEVEEQDDGGEMKQDKDEDGENTEERDAGLQAVPNQGQTIDEMEEESEEKEGDEDGEEEKKKEESCVKTHHDSQDVQGVADLQDTAETAQANSNDEKQESHGLNVGSEDSSRQDDSANKVAAERTNQEDAKETKRKRQREAKEDRSIGDGNEKSSKRIKTTDCKDAAEEYKSRDEEKPKSEESGEYSHSKDDSKPHDAQVVDAATREQAEKYQQPVSMETEEDFDEEEEVAEPTEEKEEDKEMEVDEIAELQSKQSKGAGKKDKQKPTKDDDENQEQGEGEEPVPPEPQEIPNPTNWVVRGTDSFINKPSEGGRPENEKMDIDAYRQLVEEELMNINEDLLPSDDVDQSEWSRYESATAHLSQDLCEQLRLILEPTQASKLKGDYKTGKRISMRKVIQYIASQFRKDRIWLRRTRPCKRQYEILLAIDDSESMMENGVKELTLESVAIIMNALSKLEVGNVGVVSFGKSVSVLHPLGKPFTGRCGPDLVRNLKFEQGTTDFTQMIRTSAGLFARHRQGGADEGSVPHRLLLIVSDGGIRSGVAGTRPAVRYAREQGIFTVCIIVDNPEKSIFDVRTAVFNGPGNVEFVPTMDLFPIPFYSVIRDAKNLPQTLADSLRQWFEMTTGA